MTEANFLPDEEERKAVLEDLDRNLLVEAAAGTGKTTCMVGRMVALLRTGRCARIGQIAAVTFTRKAASELRSRFQVALERACREAAAGPERKRLEAGLDEIGQCFIGTIHSFCGRLLRERPVEAGVDPAFRDLDDQEDRLLRKEAWQEFSRRVLLGDSGETLLELDRLGLRLGDLEGAFLRYTDFPDVDEWPVPSEGATLPDLGPVLQELEEYVRHMTGLGPHLPEDPGTDPLIPEYRRIPRIVRHYPNLAEPAQLMEVLERFDRNRKAVHKYWMQEGKFSREDARGEGDRWARFRQEVVAPTLERWREYRYGPVLGVLRRASALYDRLRQERGVLNYQDLLVRAARMLRENPHVRAYFSRRIRFLLVDEFQDTDPVQAEVILLLTAANPQETDWRRCEPRPGSLFVVGDPKQSIYRFRRADIVTYNEVKAILTRGSGGKERGKKTGRVVRLSANFRSHPGLIDWVNRVFEPKPRKPARGAKLEETDSDREFERFPSEPSEYSPAYVALQPGRRAFGPGDLTGVFVLTIPDDRSLKADAREYEADRIARTIRYALDSGMTVSRPKKDSPAHAAGSGEAERATVNPSDFLLVTMKKEGLSLFARKLAEYGIPHRVTGGSALNEVRELRLLHGCLRSVVWPDDPVALVGVLRSELFGVSDEELYLFRKAGGRFDFREPLPPKLDHETFGETFEAFRDAFERLRRYRFWMTRLPAVSAVERICGDLGLWALAAVGSVGDLEAGSLGKAIEMLRNLDRNGWTAVDLVDFLAELVDRAETYDGVSALPETPEAVRVMNLHKVKGLEAPVVFLADPWGNWNHEVDLHVDRAGDRVRGYLAVASAKPGGFGRAVLAQPEGWEELAKREKRFLDAEALRLRYVAATRAGSALIVTRNPKKDRLSPWAPFADFLATCPELPEPEPDAVRTVSPRPLEIPREEAAKAAAEIAGRVAAVSDPTYEVRGAKEFALAQESVWPHEPGRSSEAGLDQVAALPPSGEHGVEWGTVLHHLLDVAARAPQANLERLAAAALAEQGLDPALAPQAASQARAVMASGLWQRARASLHFLTEVPFEIWFENGPHGQGGPTLLRGAIDLVFREEGGWVLVDYKTDRIPAAGPESLAERYRPQVRLYAQCWERSTGESVKEIGLYFVAADLYLPV